MDKLELGLLLASTVIPVIGAFYYVKFNDKKQDETLKEISKKIGILFKKSDLVEKK